MFARPSGVLTFLYILITLVWVKKKQTFIQIEISTCKAERVIAGGAGDFVAAFDDGRD